MKTINKRSLPAICTLDLNKKKPWPQGLLIELSEPHRSDKDTVRSAAGKSIVPARGRAEAEALSERSKRKEDEEGCAEGGGCRSSPAEAQ